jgi:hypothetical protein
MPDAKPGLPPPRTGPIEQARRRAAIAPFTVIGGSGTNYLIKLVNAADERQHILIFVRGGEQYSTKVPLGTYKLRAASGSSWYGKDDLFGPNTQFFQLKNKGGSSNDQSLLRFYREGRKIIGTTLNFQPVQFGNLEQENISRDEFIK